MVFFVDWAGWYVIIFFFFFFLLFFVSSSVIPLLLLFLSAAVSLDNNKKQKIFFWTKILTKLKLTDDFHFFGNRIEFNGTHHKLFGIFIYSVGGMVGGWKGDFER